MSRKKHANADGLDAFVSPRTVAVIGASESMTPDGAYRVGAGIYRNMMVYPKLSPGCQVYPVNPGRQMVYGEQCYPNLLSIPGDIDLVVYVVAAKNFEALLETIRECHEKHVKGIIMISGGFAEASAGEEGKERLRQMKQALRKIRLLGPNCLGFSSWKGVNGTFLTDQPLPGHTAFISGSGGMTIPPAVRSIIEKNGLSFLASYGAGIDAGLADWMAYAAEDPQTHEVVIYTESIPNPKAFFEAAEMLRSAGKPVIAMKPGRTEAAVKAVASHSGALAGGDDIIDAAFDRAGILRAETIDQLYDVMNLFPLYPKFAALGPDEEAGAFISHAGGQGVIFADAISMAGGKLATLSPETIAKLDIAAVTPLWSRNNPVDIVGDADTGRFDRVIRVLMDAPEVHWLFVNYNPVCAVLPDKVSEVVVQIRKDYPNGKPIIVSIMGGDDWVSGDDILKNARNIIRDAGIPHIENPDNGAVAIQMLFRLKELRASLDEQSRVVPPVRESSRQMVKRIIDEARDSGRTNLDTVEVLRVFAAYGIPVVRTQIAERLRDIDAKFLRGIDYPVAVKLYSKTKEGSHKTDLGGVKLNIGNKTELLGAFREIRDAVTDKIGAEHFSGVVVQKMADRRGVETLLGKITDSILGPAVLFGWGGTETEIVHDRAVTLPGLNVTTALRLMKRTKVWKKLLGARGKDPVNIDKVVDAWIAISRLAEDFPEIDEVDINPLMAYAHDVLVVDGRITLHEKGKEREAVLSETA